MTSKLYIGTIDAAGHVTPRPVVVTPHGWHYLDGHEPPATTFTLSLLPI